MSGQSITLCVFYQSSQKAIGEVVLKKLLSLLILALKLLFGFVLSVIIILMFLGGIRYVIQYNATPPFQMVAVEGERRLHSTCAGPEDAPFVLYDAGAFGNYTDGWWVMEALREDHRVCIYDRAGMGWSDPVPAGVSPDPDWHVEDMRRLRAALGQDTPYVLIGHSMSGLRLHAYANSYPEELRGLVFVDAARPQDLKFERIRSIRPWLERAMTLSTFFARIGVNGGAAYFISDDLDHTGQRSKDKRRTLSSVQHQKATKAEITAAFEAFPNASWRVETNAEQIPVFVFTNVNGDSNAPVARAALQNTGLGGITVLPEATHVSLLNEDNAKLIARDVRKITDQKRDD